MSEEKRKAVRVTNDGAFVPRYAAAFRACIVWNAINANAVISAGMWNIGSLIMIVAAKTNRAAISHTGMAR